MANVILLVCEYGIEDAMMCYAFKCSYECTTHYNIVVMAKCT